MLLVTGATGILGRVVALQLLQKGYEVRATKRPTSDLQEVLHSFQFYTDKPKELFDKIEWVDVDFEDVNALQEVLVGIDEVYHCAAKVSFHPDDKRELYQTNIEGTKNLLYACENSSVKKFCFISSIAVLDGVNDKGELDEESDFKSALEHSAYAKSKHFSEMEVWRASAEGLDTVIVLPGVIIGSGNWSSSSGQIFKTMEKSRYTFSGGTSYVDVRDVAAISIQLMEQNKFDQRFIAISESKRYFDISKKVRKNLGLTTPSIIPDGLLNFARVFNIFGFIVPALKMVNKLNIEAITSSSKVSNQKVKDALQYDFIPVDESIDFHLKNYINDKKN